MLKVQNGVQMKLSKEEENEILDFQKRCTEEKAERIRQEEKKKEDMKNKLSMAFSSLPEQDRNQLVNHILR